MTTFDFDREYLRNKSTYQKSGKLLIICNHSHVIMPVTTVAQTVIFLEKAPKIHKGLAAGLCPDTLWELTALPQTPSWI